MKISMKCLSFVFALSTMAAPLTSAAKTPDLGRKISILRSADGRWQFGVQFGQALGTFVAMTGAVRGDQLVGTQNEVIGPVIMAFFDKTSGRLLAPWEPRAFGGGLATPSSTQAFTLAATDREQVATIIKSLRNVAVVLSLKNNSPVPTVYIDLGELCESSPDSFIDLDSGRTGCP